MQTLVLLLFFACTAWCANVTYDKIAIKIDGSRRLVLSGAIHYPRSTPSMWPDLMKKSKQAGLNTIETYIFWNLHEPVQGQYDFTGRLDIFQFVKVAAEHDLQVILRIGPYICAEINYGGFPAWLQQVPGIEFRTYNAVFMKEMAKWVTYFVDYVRPLFAVNGGPVIMLQIENEYGTVIKYYGEQGQKYIDWCINFANSLNTGLPWFMCEGGAGNALVTVNGFFGHESLKDHWKAYPNQPGFWTENWSGWYSDFGYKHTLRESTNVAYAVVRFFAMGGTAMNYYMWHGGSNWNRTSSYLLTTSYDYDAPIDEYGNIKNPKYNTLTAIHSILNTFESVLLASNERPVPHILGPKQVAYEFKNKTTSLSFVCNDDDEKIATVHFHEKRFVLKNRTCLILDMSDNVLFDSSQQGQASITRIQPVVYLHDWAWWREPTPISYVATTMDIPSSSLPYTKDDTDYAWYTKEKVQFVGSSHVINMSGVGDFAHIFINGRYMNSTSFFLPQERGIIPGPGYSQEVSFQLAPGTYDLAILTSAIGLVKIEFEFAGKSLSNERKGLWDSVTLNRNVSLTNWNFTPGLIGDLVLQLYHYPLRAPWNHGSIFFNVPLVWYRISFKLPELQDPNAVFAIQFNQMKKGLAWVNGNGIGRYWNIDAKLIKVFDPISISNDVQSQRWYHVPREWLSATNNELLVLEEIGGDPTGIQIVQVIVK